MNKIYGYCRISTKKQSIERQIRNILKEYPEADIRQEAYTGTKVAGRNELEKILKTVKKGDTIVFDSVSRMSRNASEGIELYFCLYKRGINLVFLKEGYINTDVYKQSLQNQIDLVGNEIADIYIEATNKVLRILAEKQIRIAFDQAEKEVTDSHERTREGIETARRNGKQIGRASISMLPGTIFTGAINPTLAIIASVRFFECAIPPVRTMASTFPPTTVERDPIAFARL